jgi:hypothetical protein
MFSNTYDDYKPEVWSGNHMGWVQLLQEHISKGL